MAQPTRFTITEDFSADEAANVAGRSTILTAALDAMFDDLKTTTDEICDSLGLIQRDDGELLDQIVKLHTLHPTVLALIGSGAFEIQGPWLTATAYAVGDLVTEGTGTYVCAQAHTSGVFATDLAADKWITLFDSVNYAANAISFTPTGTIAANNVQSAIAEAASEALQKADNLSDVASVSGARDSLSVPSRAAVQLWSHSAAAAGGTADAITGSFTPAITTLVGMDNLTVLVEAADASTTTTPTFTPNNGVVAPKTIVKLNGVALQVGDIAGAGHRLILSYDEANDRWVLINPAISSPLNQKKGADLAAAATIALGSDGDMFDVTSGSGDVTALSEKAAGSRVTLRFTVNGVTLKYSASLLLQDSSDHAIQAGEVITLVSLGAGPIWVEQSRKELRSRYRVGIKLALAQLAR